MGDLGVPGLRVPGRRSPWARAFLMVVLVVASALLRLGGRDFSLWVDEGMSVGIASHPLAEIPAVLAMDGSPPLYYLLLHGWMALVGSSPRAVRALSLVLVLAVIPVAYWAGRRLFSERAGWVAATLAATVPYLSVHSREARMYGLLVLVGLLAVATFLGVFAFGHRRWLPALVLSLAAVLYTHHWGLFLALGLVAATGWCVVGAAAGPARRRVALDGATAFGAVAVLYAPWVPILLGQIAETGAPWSRQPGPGDALYAVGSILGGWAAVLTLAAVVVFVVLTRRRGEGRGGSDEEPGAGLLALILAVTVAASWTASQVTPAWSPRYFGAYLPAVLLLAALALARAGRTGLAGLGLVVVSWTVPLPFLGDGATPGSAVPKSNVATLAEDLEALVGPGDVVLSTQMEQVPLLAYYLGPDLRYADPTGVVRDPRVADWRNVLARMRAADPVAVLDPLVERIEPGGHVLVVCPRQASGDHDLLWYRLMDRHCASATQALDGDPRVRRVRGTRPSTELSRAGASAAVTVFQRMGR